jgi:hypothetical protein
MDQPGRSHLEHVDAIDVHLLDITAHIEGLLRGVREVQRGILAVRQHARRPGDESRTTAPAAIAARLAFMLDDCDSLKGAIADAADKAGDLLTLAVTEEATDNR